MKAVSFLLILALSLFVFPQNVSAHSTVSPSQVKTAKYETLSLSIPTEKEVSTVGVRLLVPESLDRVTPFVKPGWNITTQKVGEKVTEIEWTGGEIPAGQKDVFQFTVRTPQKETTLVWKAYQTYADGEVVAWDRDPKSEKKGEEVKNPYSTTSVVTTLDASVEKTEKVMTEKKSNDTLALLISFVSLLLASYSLMLVKKK